MFFVVVAILSLSLYILLFGDETNVTAEAGRLIVRNLSFNAQESLGCSAALSSSFSIVNGLQFFGSSLHNWPRAKWTPLGLLLWNKDPFLCV